MFRSMAIDWTAVGAVTTGVAALATAGAATFTARMAGKTREMAEATREMALATKLDADAGIDLVAETQKDRAMAVRPVLVISGLEVDPQGWIGESFTVRNIGNGPALDCTGVFLRHPKTGDQWSVSLPLAIAAGDTILAKLEPRGRSAPMQLLEVEASGDGVQEVAAGALFCQDVLGRRHRFFARLSRKGSIEIAGTSNWQPWDREAPAWVRSGLWSE
jgi:hypothetical protein